MGISRFSRVHPKSRSVSRGRRSQQAPSLSVGSPVQASSLSSTNGRNVEVELQFRNWECHDAPLTSPHNLRRLARSMVPSFKAWVWSNRVGYNRKTNEGLLNLYRLYGMPAEISMYCTYLGKHLTFYQETPFHLFMLINLGVC
jgi:hypothetical protein